MSHWYYHAPGQGRIGPLSADDLRRHYRERRIQRDTLVWREGLPEWQPLERVADEVDLQSVTPDASLPPPLPATRPIAMTPLGAPMGGPGAARAAHAVAAPPPRRMHGCLIALLVGLALAVPGVAILAAIALPAYKDYTLRAKVAAYVEPRAALLRAGTAAAQAGLRRCPGDPLEAGLEGDAARGVRVGELDDGRCAFEITIAGVDPAVDGRTVLHVAPADGGAWDCTGGDLPARFRTGACRAPASE